MKHPIRLNGVFHLVPASSWCIIVNSMVKKRQKKAQERNSEKDGVYFLKIVLYVIAGAFWLRFADPFIIGGVTISALPVGFLIGLVFASHEKLQIDRKIEYAVLLISAVISAFLGTGIVL